MYFSEIRVGSFWESFQGPLKVDLEKPILPQSWKLREVLFIFSVWKTAACLKISQTSAALLTPPSHPRLLILLFFVFPSNSPPRFQFVATTTADWAVVRLPPSMFNPVMPPHTQT